MGAVIDAGSFATQKEAIEEARAHGDSERARRRRLRRQRGLLRRADRDRDARPGLPAPARRALRPGRHRLRLSREASTSETLDLVDRTAPYGLTGAVFARDRAAIELAGRQAPVRGRELLRQRQADRRGRRPAAVRRRARVGDERQGRLDVEPDPLGLAADDQGDVRAADRLPLPLPGARQARATASR